MSSVAWSLEEFDVLRSFKLRMPKLDSDGNSSPFDARIAISESQGANNVNVEELHADVRERIRETIELVRDGKRRSQILLISGAPGAGKTHTLNHFRSPDLQAELGHVFIGGSNHWRIDEFSAQLLDWVIQGLTNPSPTQDHLLLERIRTIGFRAIEHLLMDPLAWRSRLRRPAWLTRKLGWIGRRLRWFRIPSRDALARQVEKRDPRVFRRFDEIEFGNYVCDRFLAEPSNPVHRYVLQVLLCYLFPDPHDRGLHVRERVLHWFRGRGDNGYFARRLGVNELADQAYKQADAVRLLAHLFSATVSSKLTTEKHPCEPRVLLLTFDQVEGRNELFSRPEEWLDFFAHLSELYNTLPNIVVLFTMTIALRDSLHAKMERQFRDRIVMDSRMVLRLPSERELQTLYRHRLEAWMLGDDELAGRYRALANPLLPFQQDEFRSLVNNRTVRDVLEDLDRAFRKRLREEVIAGARYDYLFIRNELLADCDRETEWDYTSETLDTLGELLENIGEMLCEPYGIRIKDRQRTKINNVPVMSLLFEKKAGSLSVMINLARVGRTYNEPCQQLIQNCLYDKVKDRNLLFIVRPEKMNWSPPPAYSSQCQSYQATAAHELILRTVRELAGRSESYAADPELQNEFVATLSDEIRKTYVAALFQFAKERLDLRDERAI